MHYVVDAVNILFFIVSSLFQDVLVAPVPLRILTFQIYITITRNENPLDICRVYANNLLSLVLGLSLAILSG